MRDNEKAETLTKAIKRNTYQVSHQTRENSETVNHYTLFVIGGAAFFAGFWAVACLVNAFMQNGPLMMLKNLTTAVIGH